MSYRPFKGLLIIIACLFSQSVSAQGARAFSAVVGVDGTCTRVLVAGEPQACAAGAQSHKSGVMFITQNGTSMVMVGLKDGRVMTFIGGKDSQPSPEEYWLYLSRMRIVSRGTETIAAVAGVCIVKMTTDGKIWHNVNCTAKGEHGTEYAVDFVSNGHPVQQRTFQ
jgi:hypothetical protein